MDTLSLPVPGKHNPHGLDFIYDSLQSCCALGFHPMEISEAPASEIMGLRPSGIR
jgi:hypothetical protein